MTPKPHHALDYKRGLKRIKKCIYPCFFEATDKGTIFSDRFKYVIFNRRSLPNFEL